jgi:uncharacterized protein
MHKFTYDVGKAAANLRKHGVSFAEAEGVFADPLAITVTDPDTSHEERLVAIGQGVSGELLVVVFTERGDEVRLISARPASRKERKDYER